MEYYKIKLQKHKKTEKKINAKQTKKNMYFHSVRNTLHEKD